MNRVQEVRGWSAKLCPDLSGGRSEDIINVTMRAKGSYECHKGEIYETIPEEYGVPDPR